MYVVAVCKVMQQQTIGEVAHSIIFLCADNFCLLGPTTVKELLKSDKICESYAQIKRAQFFDSQCILVHPFLAILLFPQIIAIIFKMFYTG